MVRRLLFLTVALVFFQLTEAYAQMISIDMVDPGPYTPGSSIAATFSLGTTDCIARDNEFNLILVSPTNVETTIGTYAGFYAAFVNGTIPLATIAPPGPGYRLKVRSTSPVRESDLSDSFAIIPGTTVNAAVSTTTIPNSNPATFGRCFSSVNPYNFTNTSSTGDVSAIITNQLEPIPPTTPEPPTTLTFATINETKPFLTPRLAHYTVFVKARSAGTVGTKAYFLVNNRVVTAFATTASETVCFPTGTFEYAVTTDGENSIGENFPGNTYRITWGDGTENIYTYCDIVKLNKKVSHTYQASSCGVSNGSVYNAFQIVVQVMSPICGITGSPLSANARVVERPVNLFTYPPTVCLGDEAIFENYSTPGKLPNSNSNGCTDNEVTYTWWVDGVPIPSAIDVSRDFIFRYTFLTKGNHVVRLTSDSEGACQAAPEEHTVCVQDPPKPAFTLSNNLICLSSPSISANSSTSVLDNTCPNTPVYIWSVSPSAGVTFNANDPNPNFTFAQIGIYDITLSIQSGTCTVPSATQRVVVNSVPQATLSPNIKLCARGDYTFGPNGSATNTTVSGTVDRQADTYIWTVTGAGGYNFASTSTSNSQYPTINFHDFGVYTVSLTHKNNCGTITTSQELTFTESPTASITALPAAICYNENISLTGKIDPSANTTFRWEGAGTFAPNDNLITTYTPTLSERVAGVANIRLRVETGIVGECSVIYADLAVTIYPNNTGTNPVQLRSQSICSGEAAIFNPTSGVNGSTFRWTAANTSGSASGFSISGTGNINQSITNNSTTQPAIVEYTIIPEANGCDGEPFKFIATVNPLPILTASAAAATICSGESSGISLSVTNTTGASTYTWTSTPTPGVYGNTINTSRTSTTSINDVLVNTGTTQISIIYTITPYSAAGCPGTPVIVTVNVDPAVTQSNAGTSTSICDVGAHTLSGNPHKSNEIGKWTWVPKPGQTGVTIANDQLPNAEVSGLAPGQDYVFTWTISAPGICNPSSSSVTITVNPPTIAGTIDGTRTVCIGDNNGNLNLTGNTGDVLYWQRSIDGGTTWQTIANTTSTLTYNDLTITTQYRAVVKNGSCPEKTTNIIIITVAPPDTQAIAGQPQVLCNETTTTLDGNQPNVVNGESGVWTVTPLTPGLRIDNPSDPKTQVTGLAISQPYAFTWTITGNSPCGPSSSQVTVINNPPISQSISSTIAEACHGQQVTIDGTVPTGGSGGNYLYSWEMKVDAGNWTTITGEANEDLTITLTTSGSISFRRTVTSGGCTSSAEYLITVRPAITDNNITADQIVCSGVRPPNPLTGPPPQGGGGTFTYQWQSSTDEQTWTNIGGANEQDFWPAALTTTTFYRRGVSTLACSGTLQSISNVIRITVNPNAQAEFTWTTDAGCVPFRPPITTVPHPDRNATYTWFAGITQIGTGETFPANYVMTNSNDQVTIRLVVTSSRGCATNEFAHVFRTIQAVPASFTQNKTEGCGPLLINFQNTSNVNAGATFLWDFGNGTTSAQASPGIVSFEAEATGKDTTYVVTLTATTSCGSNSVTSTVLVKAKPIAIFSPSRTDGCSPMTVNFTNTSPGGAGTTYYYDFGDGSAIVERTDKSPVQHEYNTTVTTTFRATLTVVSECGTNTRAYNIRVAPQNITPELVVDASEKTGCAPHTVNFDNNSIGASRFTFDFGDGSPIQTTLTTGRVPHVYTRPDTYIITMTAYNGCSEISTTETVTVLAQPLTEFEADNTLGCPGLIVKFKNNTQNGVSYIWDFGDGSPISNEFEPTHTYTGDQEYYTVTLTATNNLGCTMTVRKNQYIHIVQPPIAAFNVNPSTLINIPDYTFRFEDQSTNTPTIWQWDFGDGTGSTLKNPSHTYLDTGTYKVTLKAINQQGCFTTTFKNVTIKGVPGYLFVPNSFVPGNTQPELREFRAKGSGIATWRFSIFNKWGQLLWESTKLEEGRPVEGWDGTFKGQQLPQGVYFWKVDVQMVNGSEWKGMTYDSSSPRRTGPIHLIR